MATLDVLLSAYAALQTSRLEADIAILTTADGKITIPAIDFLSFAGITDVALLKVYVNFIKRDKAAFGFRTLLELDWGTSPGGIYCKLTFKLTVPFANVQKLIKKSEIPVITPPTTSLPQHYFDIGSAVEINDIIDSESTKSIEVDEVFVDDLFEETNEDIADKDIAEHLPAKTKRRRSNKLFYAPATLEKYASKLERSIFDMIECSDLSGNVNLQNQLLVEVLRRLGNRVGNNETLDISQKLVENIKNLVVDMREFGNNDIEQIRFLEGLAISVSGSVSVVKIMAATGLSKRSLEYGKEMRKGFDEETKKAKAETEIDDVDDTDDAQDDSMITEELSGELGEANAEVNNESDSETIYSEASENSDDGRRKRRRERSKRGQEKKRAKTNRYRFYISRKFRKTRSDQITGVEVQRFCHESQWGGRLDTLKLFRQQIVIEQPLGGFEYESIKSYQYTIPEMYKHFKESEYGHRQRLANNNRDLSLRRFRELICPCMTLAKQRDTADEIVAEFKQCLLTWDINMRKKDSHIKASIEKCSNTECCQHKKNSASAALYALASKSPSHFMSYLLCPQIQRDELAVKVSDGLDTYSAKLEAMKADNIAAAVTAKANRELNFWASGVKKGMRVHLNMIAK